MVRTILAAIIAVVLITPTQARQKASGLHPECGVTMPCIAPYASTQDQARVTRGRYIARSMGFGVAIEKRPVRAFKRKRHHVPVEMVSSIVAPVADAVKRVAAAIVPHPSGCPSRAFCGCGAAVRVFGSPIRSLWLAANWFKFPRTAPAVGMVAVRRHHVFVLDADLGGGLWQVYDANSGRHMTRIHSRSIAGYVIVNPRGTA